MGEGPVILVIDDEIQIRRFLRLALDAHGYQVKESATGGEGLSAAAVSRPDLVILDLSLPDMEGREVLTRLREWTNLPVIVLSVRNAEKDKIELLDAGANDYLTKPFSTGELLARIRAALRHSLPDSHEGIVLVQGITVDFSKRIVMRSDTEIKLTPTEYTFFKLLVRNEGKVVTHGQIERELWGDTFQPDTSYIRVYALQLRRKIELDPSNPRIILTEPGVGYRLIAE
jgi:two-component system KDP operon response regulator KdpE